MTSTSKTTSFTTTGTLGTQTLEEDFGESSDYPVVFGITLTPLISGIACALVGVAAAAYILVNMVLPVQQANSKLENDKQQKQALLEQLKKGELEQKLIQLDVQIKQEKSTFNQVLGLLATQNNLDTLLLDINKLLNSQKTSMITFKPDAEGVKTVDDGSLGSNLDGKVRRQGIDLAIEGDFQQVQTVVQNIERLQPLLVLKNLTSEITEKPKYVFNQYTETIDVKGTPKIKISFRIDAFLPPPEEEIPKLLEPIKVEEPAKAGGDQNKNEQKK